MCLIVRLITYSARQKNAIATQHFRAAQTLTAIYTCSANLFCRI